MKTNSNWSIKARVLLSLLTRQSKCCPYCESSDTIRIGKNAILSHVRECRRCALMFRWPKQDDRFNLKFYQTKYAKVHHSPVTDLPTDKELAAYKASVFRESPRDFHNYTDLMKDLGVQTVLDYGCSWGYAVYQFKESGLHAHGLEISKPRARYGKEKLGVEIFEDPKSLITSGMKFDCIFSSHVLEHLPSPRIALDLFKAVTKPTSMLILEVPNCGGLNAEALGLKWGPFSSTLHPLSFTSSFFVNSLSPFKGNFHCTSKPFDPKEVAHRFRENPSDKCPPGDELVILKAMYQ